MDFALSTEQLAFQDSVRRFARDRIAEEPNAGTVAFNRWQASWPQTAFGRRGDSAFGLEGGVAGRQAIQQIKFTSHA